MSARPTAEQLVPFYAVAAGLLLAEIKSSDYDRLRSAPLRELIVLAAPECGVWFAEPWSEERAAELREEYARLFLLPKGVPPFASAWLDGDRDALGGQIDILVNRALDALGRKRRITEPWGCVPLDHLGLLLDLVVGAVQQAGERGSEIAAHVCEQALGPWVARFGENLSARARAPIYVALGRLLEDLHESS